ncbi:uncharacterized protein LOC133806354 [Humulus lupulus]|uniref:uncharacterized protein LOC133806354 n=1 Tax=Humulus lupulus TaxID=3486 RepID=UPI002B40895B|nr:uncharacterized protein LOC133806354 [Humulus lupulus]
MEVCNMIGWNVRGMNKRDKQNVILSICKENKVGFGALFETKVKHEKLQEVFENNFHNWDYFSSPITSGRILVFWQAKFVKVDILLEDPQLVHCRIRVSGQQKLFFATVVYGSNSMEERKKLWDKLASIGQLKYPWIIFGDFNAMFSYQDRNGGRQILAKDIADAQDCFYVIRSQEVNKVGFIPFCYGNHWLQYRGYRAAILHCWNATVGSGRGFSKVVQKLFRVKHVLKRFNREEVGDVVLNYREAKEEFCKAQEALAAYPFDLSVYQTVNQAQQNVTVMQSRYASYLKQQSKLNWVKFSDENSRFFHAIMRKRRVENRITTFTLGDKIEDDYSKVVEHFLSHFKNFIGRRSLASKEIDKNCLYQGNRLSLEHQVRLLRPFGKSDVKKALFSIHSCKSPGLDGFGSGFFKGLWTDIGDEISLAVLEFFQDGFLPKDLNETVISLIPKIADPNSASDYRPIACCNTLYKCISKMICTRLSEVLPFLVHSNQGAFIKNRVLAHNIMIFQDLLKGYTRKNISARCIMKIDLSKAYDTVDWHFVEELLKHLCFPSRFIYWILACLKGTSYNLLMNGRIQGSFKGEKGLRQGDPMSPLLFVLIMEYLTRLLAHYSDKKGFGFHPLWLSANKSKSQIFFGGVKETIKDQILGLVQMEEGSFPLKITAAIDKSCRDFLWGNNGIRSKLHLPSWEKVCLPKKLRGIGFREGKKWNMALMANFIWATTTKQDCLWVKWISSIYLKEHIIWNVPINQEMSWYFKKLLRFRQVIDEGSLRQAVKGGKFRIKHFYTTLISAQTVGFADTVWNKIIVPKHRFIYSQIFNNQLLTRDHLSRFLPLTYALCLVCDSEIELHSHLFMECIFSRKVFEEIGSLLGYLHWPKSYEELHLWCLEAVRDLKNQIVNAVLSASWYFIWSNRNNCIFDFVCKLASSISLEIKESVKYRVLGMGSLSHRKWDNYFRNVVEGW